MVSYIPLLEIERKHKVTDILYHKTKGLFFKSCIIKNKYNNQILTFKKNQKKISCIDFDINVIKNTKKNIITK